MIAHAQRGLATVRTVRADGRNVLHLPGARFIAVGAAGQGAHGADINAHPAFFALKVVLAVGDDDAVCAAHADPKRLHVHALIANAHAAEAEDAARGVVINELGPFLFGPVKLFFDEAAGIRAVAEDHVLQFALAALVADGAIQRVIGQEEFQHIFAGLAHLFGLGADDHAFRRNHGAGGLELGHLLDFDKAHAAGGLERQPWVIAERGNFRSDAAGRFNQQRARRHLDFAVVDFQRDELLVCHLVLPRAPFTLPQRALRRICTHSAHSNDLRIRCATSERC